MKGLLARRRTRARRHSGGFTLMELMIVVVLIAVIAAMAAPTMAAARGDQLAFSYARQASEIVHNARARAAGRGAAQLVVFVRSTRGKLMTYEALDGSPAAVTPPALPGPNPSPSCRANAQWTYAAALPLAPDPDRRAMPMDGLTLDAAAGTVIAQEDMTMVARGPRSATDSTLEDKDAIAICTTPNGTTYFGAGATATAAIAAMQLAAPFRQTAELVVTRRRAGVQAGLRRTLVLAGSSAPRIRSE